MSLPFQPAPNIVQSVLNMSTDGQRMQNVLHFQYAAPPTNVNIIQLGNSMINTFWNANLRNALSVNLKLDSIVTTDLSSQSGFQYVSTATGGVEIGAKGANCVPNNSTFVVSFRTATRSKNGRGRVYVAGIPVSQVPNSVYITNQEMVELVTAFGKLLTAISALGAQLVVLSRYLNGIRRPTAVGYPVVSMLADIALDSQRRRLAGRGT